MGTAGTEGAAPRASPASPLALGRVMSNAARSEAQKHEEMSYALAAARRTEKRRIVAFVSLCDFIVASTLREMLVAAADAALRLVHPLGARCRAHIEHQARVQVHLQAASLLVKAVKCWMVDPAAGTHMASKCRQAT